MSNKEETVENNISVRFVYMWLLQLILHCRLLTNCCCDVIICNSINFQFNIIYNDIIFNVRDNRPGVLGDFAMVIL